MPVNIMQKVKETFQGSFNSLSNNIYFKTKEVWTLPNIILGKATERHLLE